MFIRPFAMGGTTKSGIKLNFHDKLYQIYGEVLDAHPSCRYVRVGDFVIFMPNRPVKLKRPGGPVYALREMQVLGIVDPGDGEVWFLPPKEEPVVLPSILLA